MSAPTIEPLENVAWLAKVLGISKATIYRLRSEGKHSELPPTIMVGAQPRWRPSAVSKWLEDREGKTSEAA